MHWKCEFKDYVSASARNSAKFSLKGPAELSASLIHHYRQDLESKFTPGTMTNYEVGKHIEDYALLNRVVNLFKHSSKTDSNELINSKSQINETLVINWFPGNVAPYSYGHMRIIIQLNSGNKRDLLQVVTNVINGWSNLLIGSGLIPKEKARFYRYTGDDYLTPDQAKLIPDPMLSFKPGEKFDLIVINRGYNYETNLFDPVPFVNHTP